MSDAATRAAECPACGGTGQRYIDDATDQHGAMAEVLGVSRPCPRCAPPPPQQDPATRAAERIGADVFGTLIPQEFIARAAAIIREESAPPPPQPAHEWVRHAPDERWCRKCRIENDDGKPCPGTPQPAPPREGEGVGHVVAVAIGAARSTLWMAQQYAEGKGDTSYDMECYRQTRDALERAWEWLQSGGLTARDGEVERKMAELERKAADLAARLDRYEAAGGEVERLRAIVRRLPTLEDGVYALPGDEAWVHWHGKGVVKGIVCFDYTKDQDEQWSVWVESLMDSTNDPDGCYSTEAACKEALGGAGGGRC